MLRRSIILEMSRVSRASVRAKESDKDFSLEVKPIFLRSEATSTDLFAFPFLQILLDFENMRIQKYKTLVNNYD